MAEAPPFPTNVHAFQAIVEAVNKELGVVVAVKLVKGECRFGAESATAVVLWREGKRYTTSLALLMDKCRRCILTNPHTFYEDEFVIGFRLGMADFNSRESVLEAP